MSSLNLTQLVNWAGVKETCSGIGCHVRNLNHSFLARKNGVRIGESWFCCSDCFREGVETRIRELQQAGECRHVARTFRRPLGLLLVARGCITNEQLHIALERQCAQGGALGDILCDLRFTSEREVTEATATQWGCAVYSAKFKPCGIQTHIPTTLLNLAAMAPVYHAVTANRLLIGFVHGIDHHALRTIEEMTCCLAEPCFITATECRESIHSLAGRNVEVAFDRISSVAEMANIVQSYAFQIGADEARFAICCGELWVRLNRDRQPTDLLFSLPDQQAGSLERDSDWLRT